VRAAVLNEIEGPGRLLGYRAMHKKLRLRYGLNTPRNRVYDVMTDVDPEGLENRRPGAKTKKKGSFHSPGPNWVYTFKWKCSISFFMDANKGVKLTERSRKKYSPHRRFLFYFYIAKSLVFHLFISIISYISSIFVNWYRLQKQNGRKIRFVKKT